LKLSEGRNKRSFAVLSALIPVLCLAGCAAGRHVASSQDAMADSGGESEWSAVDAREGAFNGVAETERSDSPGLGPDRESSGAEPDVDPATLVAQALETCESAGVFWEQGDIEEALAALDLAYELLL
jgi:hypothetical protein